MKRTLLYIITLLGLMTACQQDPEIPIVSLSVKDKVEAEWTDASVSGDVNTNTKIESFYMLLSTNESMDNATEVETKYDEGKFTLSLPSLVPQTKYYYQYKAANKLGSYNDDKTFSFKTKDYVTPIVTTDSVNHITGKKAGLFGHIVFTCYKAIEECGFEYGLDADHLTKVVADSANLSASLTQLSFGNTYYYRAFATSAIGTGYGELKTFKTCDVVKFGSVEVDDITANSATATYSLQSTGGVPVQKQGLMYWQQGATDTTRVATDKEASLNQLTKDKTYHVCAYAETEDSCFYSEAKEFKTKNGVITLTTTTPTDVTYTSVTLGGQITDDGGATITERGICWSTQANPTTSNSKQKATSNSFTSSVTSLTENTKYYVRAYAMNQYSTYYGGGKIFTTTAYTRPTVSTIEASDISYTTATCGGNVTSDGGLTITERGVCYATTNNPTTSNDKVIAGSSGTGSYTCNLTGLADGKVYYYRAYAVNSKGTSYGIVRMFSTSVYNAPTVTTAEVSNISYTSATCGGDVASDGGATITERGVCYATTNNPTISNNKVVASSAGTGTFTCNLNNLTDGTIYYIRAYAKNSKGVSYGVSTSFTTKKYYAPTVITSAVTNISDVSASCGGNVTADGGLTVTECGVCYATTSNPTTSNNKVVAATAGTGAFSCNLTNLTEGTTYYIRAYAINSKGTTYGSSTSFTTIKYYAPTVTTSVVSNITNTTASCGGNVTADGGLSVTERGICYATTSNPTTSDNKVTASSTGTGTFTCSLSNLTNGTTYYVRAYATNSKGTSYGESQTFTTIAYTTPTIIASPVTAISYTSATCGGNVTSDGGLSVTERGVCYATTSNPTTSNNKVVAATAGTGAFSCNITSLADGTTYYVRVYAINDQGTSYGECQSFTTTAYTTPIVTSSAVTDITYTSAIGGGNVTADGGLSVTERGICYATTNNPTTSSSKVVATTVGIGAFSCNLTNLTEGTTYYIRAYAINSKGTSYGEQETFTTDSAVGIENGYAWVDLGLPSGLKWATCNIGANSPDECGNYYAWGETETKTNYDWNTYKHCIVTNVSVITFTKYCTNSESGIVDNKTTLEKMDDAASVNWGGNWRMPTKAEWQELRENCIWTQASMTDGFGYMVTSKDSTNKNSIFLPLWYTLGGGMYYKEGRYLSSTLYTENIYQAWVEYLTYDNRPEFRQQEYGYSRSSGLPIRAVCP